MPSDSERKLQTVADIAAFCMIDLGSNLKSAYDEYMAGKISNGAYQHVLHRHGQLTAALHDAGYTDKHPVYEFPIRPKQQEPKP